jgi:hypothetical protein
MKSGLRGHRRTNLTILESADHALFKIERYVLLRPLRPELDGQDPFQTFQTLAKQFDRASPLSGKGEGSWKSPFQESKSQHSMTHLYN